MKNLFNIPQKIPVWLEHSSGHIKFPRGGVFRQLRPQETYYLKSRQNLADDSDHLVIDLTLSPPSQGASTPLAPDESATFSNVEGGATPSGGREATSHCLGPPTSPVQCVKCHNVMGCLKHLMEWL